MSEKDIELLISKELAAHFEFMPKVKGTHFSKKILEIDYIIKPKNTSGWKNSDIVFGLEFKDMIRLDQKGDTTDFTKWIAQCVDYSNTYWDGFGYINVLTCPGISTSVFMGAAYNNRMLLNVLSHMGIGELKRSINYGWTIYLQGHHRMWSEKEGVSSGKFWSLQRKFGSR